MGMLHVHAAAQELSVTIGGETVPCAHVVLEASLGTAPRVTLVPLDGAAVNVDGVVQVVRDPTPAEVDAAAVDAIGRIDPKVFEQACMDKLAAGRRDPYVVALETIREMADG